MKLNLDTLIEKTRPPGNARVRRMIRRYHGRVMPFRNLPRPAQLAMAFYMSVDGEAWVLPEAAWVCAVRDAAFMARFAGQLPTFIAEHGGQSFGLVQIPMKALVASICEDYGHPGGRTLMEDYGSFEAYHAWYVSSGSGPVTHPAHDPWPVILNTEMDWETLQDGWHRFHRYYDLGLATVPAIYYPDRPEQA